LVFLTSSRQKTCPSFLSLDAPVSSTGQALLNTKQNKISQGRLIESGMTVRVVIPAKAGIQRNGALRYVLQLLDRS
jgi:hypothetical protein